METGLYPECVAEYGFSDNSVNKNGLKKVPIVLCPPEGASLLIKEGRTPVFLVRHGQTDWNLILRLQGREHVDLNDHGIRQSEECAGLLLKAKEYGFDPKAIYSSPLSRAFVTSEIISEKLLLGDPRVCDGIIERDYGELSGLTLAERKKRFPKGERQAKGVESVPEAAFRMKKALVSITEKEAGDVIAVTHGGIINALFLKITNGKVGTGKNISENCGISIVAVDEKVTIPLAYNLTGEGFLDYISGMKNKKPDR